MQDPVVLSSINLSLRISLQAGMLSDESRKCESDLVANRARFHDAVKSNYRWRGRENRGGRGLTQGRQQREEAKSKGYEYFNGNIIIFHPRLAQARQSVTQEELWPFFWLIIRIVVFF